MESIFTLNNLVGIGVLVGYFAIQIWVLPKMGIPT